MAAGHRPGDVWSYTPKQIAAWLHFASKRKRAEAAHSLAIAAMGARGDPKKVQQQIKELSR